MNNNKIEVIREDSHLAHSKREAPGDVGNPSPSKLMGTSARNCASSDNHTKVPLQSQEAVEGDHTLNLKQQPVEVDTVTKSINEAVDHATGLLKCLLGEYVVVVFYVLAMRQHRRIASQL